MATSETTLNAMNPGDYAKIPLSMAVPSSITAGSYYIVSIQDSVSTDKLATDFKVIYRG